MKIPSNNFWQIGKGRKRKIWIKNLISPYFFHFVSQYLTNFQTDLIWFLNVCCAIKCVCLFEVSYDLWKKCTKILSFLLDRRKEESKPNISNEKKLFTYLVSSSTYLVRGTKSLELRWGYRFFFDLGGSVFFLSMP